MNIYFIVLIIWYALSLGVALQRATAEKKPSIFTTTLISATCVVTLVVMAIKTGF